MKHRLTAVALTVLLLARAAGAARVEAAPADREVLQPEDFWKHPGLSLVFPAVGNLLNFEPLVAADSRGIIPWVIYPSQLLSHR